MYVLEIWRLFEHSVNVSLQWHSIKMAVPTAAAAATPANAQSTTTAAYGFFHEKDGQRDNVECVKV